jgi:hypothetical protein
MEPTTNISIERKGKRERERSCVWDTFIIYNEAQKAGEEGTRSITLTHKCLGIVMRDCSVQHETKNRTKIPHYYYYYY